MRSPEAEVRAVHADASVLNREIGDAVLLLAQAHVDRDVVPGVLDRVVEEVEDRGIERG